MANWNKVSRTIKYYEHLNDNFDSLLESECGLAWEWETIGGYSVERDTLLSILPPETPKILTEKIQERHSLASGKGRGLIVVQYG